MILQKLYIFIHKLTEDIYSEVFILVLYLLAFALHAIGRIEEAINELNHTLL